MTKTFCDCCGKEMVGENRKYDTLIVNLNNAVSPIGGFAIISPTGNPWAQHDVCERCVANAVIGALSVELRNSKAIITPPPKTSLVSDLFQSATLQAEIDKLVKEAFHHQSKLTYNQLKAAFIQAIQSGDIVKHVSVAGNAQTVVYWPYRKKVELERKIEVLQALLDRVEPVTIGRDFRSKSIETLCEDIKKERQP